MKQYLDYDVKDLKTKLVGNKGIDSIVQDCEKAGHTVYHIPCYVIDALVHIFKFSSVEREIYLWLWLHTDNNNEYETTNTILANEFNVSETTIKKVIANLKKVGLIKVIRKGHSSCKSKYKIASIVFTNK